jgi:hypothetical protein
MASDTKTGTPSAVQGPSARFSSKKAQIALVAGTALVSFLFGLPAWWVVVFFAGYVIIGDQRAPDAASFKLAEAIFLVAAFLAYLSTAITIGLSVSALISQRRLTKLALVGLAVTVLLVGATVMAWVGAYSCWTAYSYSGR